MGEPASPVSGTHSPKRPYAKTACSRTFFADGDTLISSPTTMKIFAVYGRLQLTKQPIWLKAMRARYAATTEYHVTLKQPCFVEEAQLPKLQSRLNELCNGLAVPDHRIALLFDRLYAEQDAIMVQAEAAGPIIALQSRLREALKDFKRYVASELEGYEIEFHPHFSLLSDLTPAQFTAARREIGADYECAGTIEEIVLAVYDSEPAARTTNAPDLTAYPL